MGPRARGQQRDDHRRQQKRDWHRRRREENDRQAEQSRARQVEEARRSHPRLYRFIESPEFRDWWRRWTGREWDPRVNADPEKVLARLELVLLGFEG